MINLNGWNLATSIKLDYLNTPLTAQISGKPFAASEDTIKVSGKFDAWALKANAEGGKPDLLVTASGNLTGADDSPAAFDHLEIRFQVDIAHMPKSDTNPDDFVHIKFDAKGIGRGDTSLYNVSDPKGANKQLSQDDKDLIAVLTINSICSNKAMAAMPIAVLMSKTSLNADWYKPTHVDYAVSTLESGETYISILVCVDNNNPPAGPPQAPAGLHIGYVNMAMSRNIFENHVLVPTLKKQLPSSAAVNPAQNELFWKGSGDPLKRFTWPSILDQLTYVVYTVMPGFKIAMNFDLKSASATWHLSNLSMQMAGRFYLAPGGAWTAITSNTQWYTFDGSCTYTIGFDEKAQRLRISHQSCTDPNISAKGVVGVIGNWFKKPPKMDMNGLVHIFCALGVFPSPDQYSFLWAGMDSIKYHSANFDGDVVFASAPDGYQ